MLLVKIRILNINLHNQKQCLIKRSMFHFWQWISRFIFLYSIRIADHRSLTVIFMTMFLSYMFKNWGTYPLFKYQMPKYQDNAFITVGFSASGIDLRFNTLRKLFERSLTIDACMNLVSLCINIINIYLFLQLSWHFNSLQPAKGASK